jgi:hypothetical protein
MMKSRDLLANKDVHAGGAIATGIYPAPMCPMEMTTRMRRKQIAQTTVALAPAQEGSVASASEMQ